MATRKRKAKKSTRSKTGARTSRARGPAKKAKTAKRSAKKKAVSKAASAKKTTRVKSTRARSASRPKKKDQKRRQPATSDAFRNSSGLLAGDLQGLSNVESADSESVDELMEEGNAFEAGVVSGVEESRKRGG